MLPPDHTDEQRIKATVRHLLELLRQFGNSPAKVIPWPKAGSKKGSDRLEPS
jgi:hypothetical protein